MKEREALTLALKALNTPRPSDSYPPLWRAYETTINSAIKACEEALAQPAVTESHKQEPVAYQDTAEKCRLETVPANGTLFHTTPPYVATPRQRTWVHATEWRGLTDEEIKDCMAVTFTETIAKAEAKLKEKNT